MDSSSPTAPLPPPFSPRFPSLSCSRRLPLVPLSPTLCHLPRGTTVASFVALLLPPLKYQ